MPITFINILKSKRFIFSDEFYDDDRIITYVRPFLSIPKLKKEQLILDLMKERIYLKNILKKMVCLILFMYILF